jgi:oxygen-independent coproporphyrinogen-3 oxidase
MNKLNHLYIHIPFCKHICTYCDFKRFIANEQDMTKYVNKVIRELNKKYRNNKFKTIYIGGGTPNSLSKTNLIKLLRTLNKHLNKDYEFTMECNPEFVTKEQTQIMKTYGVNRVSLGVQTTNEKLLEKINRKHDVRDVINAISNLRLVQINNISCDFIYGFNEMNNEDLQQDIKFIVKHKIPHVSFYSLEIKPGSVIQKHNYVCNEEHVESQFKYIIDKLKNTQFHRYEISS